MAEGNFYCDKCLKDITYITRKYKGLLSSFYYKWKFENNKWSLGYRDHDTALTWEKFSTVEELNKYVTYWECSKCKAQKKSFADFIQNYPNINSNTINKKE